MTLPDSKMGWMLELFNCTVEVSTTLFIPKTKSLFTYIMTSVFFNGTRLINTVKENVVLGCSRYVLPKLLTGVCFVPLETFSLELVSLGLRYYYTLFVQTGIEVSICDRDWRARCPPVGWEMGLPFVMEREGTDEGCTTRTFLANLVSVIHRQDSEHLYQSLGVFKQKVVQHPWSTSR